MGFKRIELLAQKQAVFAYLTSLRTMPPKTLVPLGLGTVAVVELLIDMSEKYLVQVDREILEEEVAILDGFEADLP